MLTEKLKKEIDRLFNSTPENIGVTYGMKMKNGEYTGENTIVFTTEKKIPLNEIPEGEVLPTEIEIDNVIYKTDVIEVGKVTIIAAFDCTITPCSSTPLGSQICSSCYSWINVPPINRTTMRPIMGGLAVTSQHNAGGVGTLGFLALDKKTNGLVGVSNNHVLIRDATYTLYRNLPMQDNESYDSVIQSPEYGININNKIGEVVRYVPIHTTDSIELNYVDGSLTSISASTISLLTSWNQFGLTGITSPMPFATTQEIDELLTTYSGCEIWSAGRTSGTKQGICGLKIVGVNANTPVGGYKKEASLITVNFNDTIMFTRLTPDCPYPIYPGDSGSALIAVLNGVPKIIGLCFAGSDYYGYACRIDRVAQELDIVAWTGQTPNYINLATKKFVTLPNHNIQKTLICSGETYWQVGLTQFDYPCDCQGVKLTFTANTNTTVGFSIYGSSSFSMTVNWGDDIITTYNGNTFYTPTHTYSTNGTYEVEIGVNNCNLITQLTVAGTQQIKSPLVNFSGLENLTSLTTISFYDTTLANFNPAVQLPNSLRLLIIYNNLFTSFNPTLPLPSGLNYLNLNGNFITSFNPTLQLPTSLISLDVGGNRLTSFNPSLSLPSGLKTLNLSRNLITSFTPTLQLPLTLTNISVNVNPMNQTAVNDSLIYLDAVPWVSIPPKIIDLISTDGNAIPSGAGLVAKNNLIGAGWSVSTW